MTTRSHCEGGHDRTASLQATSMDWDTVALGSMNLRVRLVTGLDCADASPACQSGALLSREPAWPVRRESPPRISQAHHRLTTIAPGLANQLGMGAIAGSAFYPVKQMTGLASE